MEPYGIISDTHCHNWSSFATVGSDGINSRLRAILDETIRCAETVGAAGGKRIYHAGDLFHVRGSIAPSVLNPTLEVYSKLIKLGFEITLIAGNHDLEGKNSERVSSAITALEEVGCRVVNTSLEGDCDESVFTLPWHQDIEELKGEIESLAKKYPFTKHARDLIIHAPIDDVIIGLPSHGLTSEWLAEQGFNRVFAGHYHNHKDFKNGVYSVGAIAHHTWSDIGSKAGFLVVTNDSVKWHCSAAPKFIEINSDTLEDEIPLVVDGNYVRARIGVATNAEIEGMREQLMKWGAKAVTFVTQKDSSGTTTRSLSSIKAGASIEESVKEFIKLKGAEIEPELTEDVMRACMSTLELAKIELKGGL